MVGREGEECLQCKRGKYPRIEGKRVCIPLGFPGRPQGSEKMIETGTTLETRSLGLVKGPEASWHELNTN